MQLANKMAIRSIGIQTKEKTFEYLVPLELRIHLNAKIGKGLHSEWDYLLEPL